MKLTHANTYQSRNFRQGRTIFSAVDVKTRYTLDPADVAKTRIPIRLFFVAYRCKSLRAANVRGLVLRELPQLFSSNFSGDHRNANLAERGKLCANCYNGNKLRFLRFLQKYMYSYDGPKYMLRILIPVRMGPDLFKQIRILERTMAVRAMNFQSCNSSCGKSRRI
jgi:hypothetical protein